MVSVDKTCSLLLQCKYLLYIHTGGPDGRYTFVNEEDYRSDKIKSGVKYQLQAIHTTLVHHYNDTLNFLIRSNTSEITFLEVNLQAK